MAHFLTLVILPPELTVSGLLYPYTHDEMMLGRRGTRWDSWEIEGRSYTARSQKRRGWRGCCAFCGASASAWLQRT